jgi:outer membrane immunogenic protein
MKRVLFGIAAIAALIGTPALAADLMYKAPPPPSVWTWTGFYVGGNLGYGWGNRSVNYSPNDPQSAFNLGVGAGPFTRSLPDSGVLGGLQLGYNLQLNRNWLVGLETDFDWSGMTGSVTSSGPFLNGAGLTYSDTVTEKVDWFGTVRGRLGYLPMDNFLTYFTGGFAYGRIDRTGNYVLPPGAGAMGGFGSTCPAGGAPCHFGSLSSTDAGWTLGAGFEYAVLKNWTLKAEYLYVNLGGKSLTEPALIPFGANALSSFNANYSNAAFNVARVGVNYRFGGPSHP